MKLLPGYSDPFLDPITGKMFSFDAGFILKDASPFFPNAQTLVTLDNGILKNNTGVIEIAMGGHDYIDLISTENPIQNHVVVWDSSEDKWLRNTGVNISTDNNISGVHSIEVADYVKANNAVKSREFTFYDDSYINNVNLKAPGTISNNINWVMPDIISHQGQVLTDVGNNGADRQLQFRNILPDGLQDNILAQGKDAQNNPIFINATLAEGKIWKGNASGYPEQVPYTPTVNNASYILQKPHSDLPNAQALSTLSSGILKLTSFSNALHIASPGSNTFLNDYVDPATLQSFVADKINTSKIYIDDAHSSFPSPPRHILSHVIGSGNLTAWNNTTHNNISLRLAETIHMDNDLTFVFDETPQGRDFTMKIYHTNAITQGVATPFRINFFAQDRHLDLLQPSGIYRSTKGFFFQSNFGYNGIYDEPSSFVLKVLKHRDDKEFYHQEDQIENILTYDRATESIYFNKPIHFDRKRLLMVADPEHDYDAVHKKYVDSVDDKIPTITGTEDHIEVSFEDTNYAISLAENPTIPGRRYLKIPAGASHERPAIPEIGMIRILTV